MKKIFITIIVLLLMQMFTAICKNFEFYQISGFGILPLRSNSILGYGINLNYGFFDTRGFFSFGWNGSIGSISATNIERFTKNENFKNSGLYLNSNVELNYLIFSRKEFTPYVGFGLGYTILGFNAVSAFLSSINLNTGLIIPLGKDFEFNVDIRTPLNWRLEPNEKTTYYYFNTHIGFTYKV
jgi:hypothetical protein